MVHKIVIAILLIVGIPAALFLGFDALMLRSRTTPLAAYDFWVCLGGAVVILLLEAWGLRSLLRGQFRTKRKLKIAALSVTAFVFLIWQASVVLVLGHAWPCGVWTFLSNGCFEGGIDRSGGAAGWTTIVELPTYPPSISWGRIEWMPKIWWLRNGAWDAIRLPLWGLYLATLIPTILLFMRHRNVPSGFCKKCSYDLTGNVSGICPECGEAVCSRASQSADH